MLETKELNGVEIFKAGTWTDSSGTTDTYTVEDLKGIVQVFNELKEKVRPYLKISHKGKSRYREDSDLPALGWVKNLKMIGNVLVADFYKVPKTLVTLATTGAFPRVSAEIYHNAEIGGKVRKLALKAVALLGVQLPALDSLKSIADLYSVPFSEGADVHEFNMEEGSLELIFSVMEGDPGGIQELDPNSDNGNHSQTKGGETEMPMTEEEIKKMQAENEKLKVDNQSLSGKATELEKKNEELSTSQVEIQLQKKVDEATAVMEKAFDRLAFAPVIKDHMKSIIRALAESDSVTVKFGEKDVSGLDVFKDLMGTAPVVSGKFEEKLHDKGDPAKGKSHEGKLQVSAQVDQKVREYMAQHPQIGYSTATSIIFNQEPDLAQAYAEQNTNLKAVQ